MKNETLYSIRCFNAIAEMVGGRKNLAKKLGLKNHQSLHNWIFRKKIPPAQVWNLVKLGEGKFSAEELLGKFDHVD